MGLFYTMADPNHEEAEEFERARRELFDRHGPTLVQILRGARDQCQESDDSCAKLRLSLEQIDVLGQSLAIAMCSYPEELLGQNRRKTVDSADSTL